jgi:uncharacterized membrane protein YiaA
MIRIFNKAMFFVGMILFIIGICSADSENLIYPLVMTFGGIFIAYKTRGDFYDND